MDPIGDLSLVEDIAPDMTEKLPSSGTMITTLLLLISTLLLTTYTLLFHTVDAIEDKEGFVSALQAMTEKAPPKPTLITINKDAVTTKTAPEKAAALTTPPPKKKEKKGGFFSRGMGTKWPSLKVTGYGTSSNAGGFAIVNGQQVMLNETIGKVRLVEIRSQDVVFELNGERKNISIDQ